VENRLPQQQERVSRVDKVVLPSDSSFVQSPAQLRAFVKRRGPALTQQQTSSQQQAIVDGSAITAAPEQPQEVAVESSSTLLDRARKPMHVLALSMAHIVSGMFRGLSHPALLYYCAALLGTSVGFVQFLYFSTVGYASGIALPVGLQMLVNRATAAVPLLSSANLSSVLVLLWGVRLGAFLLWREYLNWPALHSHMRHVKAPPLVPTQLLGWVVYSGLYLCVASPVLFQQQNLKNATTAADWTGKSSRPVAHHHSKVALALQVAGLLLEATADLQKSLFKAQYRHDWCNVGVWRYSTHPNYLGEALFWVGAHLNGLSNLIHSRHQRSLLALTAQLLTSGAGLSFVLSVLRGAVVHSEDTQRRKYGTDPSFAAFQETYGLFGYRLFQQSIRPALRRALASSMGEVFDEVS
jgi:steroid 5-alpha reductase family enzyme